MAALRLAVTNNNLPEVQRLLADPDIDPAAGQNRALGLACDLGFTRITRSLLADPRVDPSDNDNYAIQIACRKGYITIITLLLADRRVNPGVNSNYPLRTAIEVGRLNVVKLLLADTRVNPRDQDPELQRALRITTINSNTEIVRLFNEDLNAYPTYAKRQHNLPLDLKIKEIEDTIQKLYTEKLFYFRVYHTTEQNPDGPDTKIQNLATVMTNKLDSEIYNLLPEIKTIEAQKI